jgi:hypothetical protein
MDGGISLFGDSMKPISFSPDKTMLPKKKSVKKKKKVTKVDPVAEAIKRHEEE